MSETRLEAIEAKIALLEHTVEELNNSLYAQQQQIERQRP
jgi:uncharacterized coiled-coil protein SlyX